MKIKLQFARRVIKRINRLEDEKVGQTKQTATSEIKVHCLSHKRATQCDPSLA